MEFKFQGFLFRACISFPKLTGSSLEMHRTQTQATCLVWWWSWDLGVASGLIIPPSPLAGPKQQRAPLHTVTLSWSQRDHGRSTPGWPRTHLEVRRSKWVCRTKGLISGGSGPALCSSWHSEAGPRETKKAKVLLSACLRARSTIWTRNWIEVEIKH